MAPKFILAVHDMWNPHVILFLVTIGTVNWEWATTWGVTIEESGAGRHREVVGEGSTARGVTGEGLRCGSGLCGLLLPLGGGQEARWARRRPHRETRHTGEHPRRGGNRRHYYRNGFGGRRNRLFEASITTASVQKSR